MADQLEEIKRKIDIVEFINGFVPLKKTGRNFKALCPFHQETVPSFIVSPERQIWHCFGACFPKGALIKTDKGDHSIEKIKIGQLVLTHRGRLRPVIRILKRFYDGDLVDIKTRKFTEAVSLTVDHQVYVMRNRTCKQKSRQTRICQKRCKQRCPTKYFENYKIEEIPAGELSLNDYLLFPINKKIRDLKFIKLSDYLTRNISFYARRLKKIPESIELSKEFLQLMGYWIAEGNIDNYGHVVFAVGNHERNFANDITRLIKRNFNLDSVIRDKTNKKHNSSGLAIIANSSNLANIFENLCGRGAFNKHIPFELQYLPIEKQKIILEAIFRGDGYTGFVSDTKEKRRFKAITTVSPILAEQITDILLRQEIIPTITVADSKVDKKRVNHQKAYTISWQDNILAHYADFYEKEKTSYALFPVKEIKRRKFKGNVYNLTVEDDHSYVARNFVVANCGEGGDIFKFLMKIENLDFGEALRELANRAGVKLTRYQPSKGERQKQLLYEINHLASEFYHYLLLNHSAGKRALNYILGRGINRESLQLFKLGFAPSSWESLQRFLVNKKGYRVEDLEKAGLVIERAGEQESGRAGKYYDRFRGRLMFPLKDHRGNVCGFAGRVLEQEAKEARLRQGFGGQAKYINTPETLIYHKSDLLYGLFETHQEIKKTDEVVVVEGELDAISSYQAGVKNVVAIKGSAITAGQVQLLSRFSKNITFALDKDIAGDQAAKRGIEIADEAGAAIKVVELKGGKDPDEVAQKEAENWRKLVLEAVPIYDYFLDSAFSRFDFKTAEGKRKIGEELIPILAKISNEIVRDHYVSQLAERLDVSEEAIFGEIGKMENGKWKRENGKPASAKTLVGEEKSRREVLEEHLLALGFQGGKWDYLRKRQIRSLVKTPRFEGILEALGEYRKKYKSFDSSRLAKMLPAELVEVFDGLYLINLADLATEEEKFAQEFKKTLSQLLKIDLQELLNQTAAKIKKLEKQEKLSKNEEKQLDFLHQEFRDLSQKLSEV